VQRLRVLGLLDAKTRMLTPAKLDRVAEYAAAFAAALREAGVE
jgi:hypothetical protein